MERPSCFATQIALHERQCSLYFPPAILTNQVESYYSVAVDFFFLFLLSDIHHSFNRVLIQWATLFAFHFHCLYFSILSLLLNAINPAARLINQMLALS